MGIFRTQRHGWWAALLAALALIQGGRLITAISLPRTSLAYIPPARPALLLFSALWAAVFLVSAVRLWQGRAQPWHALVWISAYALYELMRLLIWAQADYDRQRIPFLAALVLFLVLSTSMAYARQRRREGRAEEEQHDGSKPQD